MSQSKLKSLYIVLKPSIFKGHAEDLKLDLEFCG